MSKNEFTFNDRDTGHTKAPAPSGIRLKINGKEIDPPETEKEIEIEYNQGQAHIISMHINPHLKN